MSGKLCRKKELILMIVSWMPDLKEIKLRILISRNWKISKLLENNLENTKNKIFKYKLINVLKVSNPHKFSKQVTNGTAPNAKTTNWQKNNSAYIVRQRS